VQRDANPLDAGTQLYSYWFRWMRRPEEFFLPSPPQFFTPCQHVILRLREVLVYALPLDEIARPAARYEIPWILPALKGARHYKINGHDQCVFEAGLPIQAAVSAAKAIALQNLQAFRLAHRYFHARQGHDLNGMAHLLFSH
jgi:hypothetical protein